MNKQFYNEITKEIDLNEYRAWLEYSNKVMQQRIKDAIELLNNNGFSVIQKGE